MTVNANKIGIGVKMDGGCIDLGRTGMVSPQRPTAICKPTRCPLAEHLRSATHLVTEPAHRKRNQARLGCDDLFLGWAFLGTHPLLSRRRIMLLSLQLAQETNILKDASTAREIIDDCWKH